MFLLRSVTNHGTTKLSKFGTQTSGVNYKLKQMKQRASIMLHLKRANIQ